MSHYDNERDLFDERERQYRGRSAAIGQNGNDGDHYAAIEAQARRWRWLAERINVGDLQLLASLPKAGSRLKALESVIDGFIEAAE